MKKCLLAIAAFALLLNVNAQELPKTQIKEIRSGRAIEFDDIFEKGKVTLVSFWATWCMPGKREVKMISRNMADWKKKVSFNYIAIAIDQQHNTDLARTYVQAQGWKFPVYIDANSDLKEPLNFLALPFIMIIDKKGRVAYTHTGYLDGEQLLAQLKKVVAR